MWRGHEVIHPSHVATSTLLNLCILVSPANAQSPCVDNVQSDGPHAPLQRVYLTALEPRRTICTTPPSRDSVLSVERALNASLRACLHESSSANRTVALVVLSRGRVASFHLEPGRLSFDVRCLSDHLRAIRLTAPESSQRRRTCRCSWEHFSYAFEVFRDAR